MSTYKKNHTAVTTLDLMAMRQRNEPIVAVTASHRSKRGDSRQAITRDHDRQQRRIERRQRQERGKLLGEDERVRAWLVGRRRLRDAGQQYVPGQFVRRVRTRTEQPAGIRPRPFNSRFGKRRGRGNAAADAAQHAPRNPMFVHGRPTRPSARAVSARATASNR